MKKVLVFAILILCTLPLIYADNHSTILLTFKDISNDKHISDVVVHGSTDGYQKNQYLGAEDIFSWELDPGQYTLTLQADNPLTSGKDYFKVEPIHFDERLVDVVYLYPVGTLRGMVKDTFENIVGNAELRFECTTSFGTDFPQYTTKFGSFEVKEILLMESKLTPEGPVYTVVKKFPLQ